MPEIQRVALDTRRSWLHIFRLLVESNTNRCRHNKFHGFDKHQDGIVKGIFNVIIQDWYSDSKSKLDHQAVLSPTNTGSSIKPNC